MRQTMTRTEMVQLLVDKGGIPKFQAEFLLDTLFENIEEWIKEGKEVMLPKIGRFMFNKMDSVRRSNLKPGFVIGPHYRVRFRMNQGLARYVRVNTREK